MYVCFLFVFFYVEKELVIERGREKEGKSVWELKFIQKKLTCPDADAPKAACARTRLLVKDSLYILPSNISLRERIEV
jgi:hypothetical protein